MRTFMLILIGIIVVLGAALKITIGNWYAEKTEKNRIYEAFAANQQIQERIETLDGRLAAQSKVIALQSKELEELYPAMHREIENLKVKVGRVQTASQTVFHSENQITTTLRDSIVFDTLHVKVFDYKDDYLTVNGITLKDTQRLSIAIHDTLVQVVYKGRRKRPYLWLLSKRQLEQRVSLKNTNAAIEYSKVIQVQ